MSPWSCALPVPAPSRTLSRLPSPGQLGSPLDNRGADASQSTALQDQSCRLPGVTLAARRCHTPQGHGTGTGAQDTGSAASATPRDNSEPSVCCWGDHV